MKVKKFLQDISQLLKTHECVTLTNSSTQLIIDIEHNNQFHAVGIYSKSDIEGYHFDITILAPFQNSFYRTDAHTEYSVLADFEVYRWKLVRDDEEKYQWHLFIETKQT